MSGELKQGSETRKKEKAEPRCYTTVEALTVYHGFLYVIVVMLKPLIATSLDELSRKTFRIHPQLMVLALG